jgi:membrane-bound ClpP family serine protease
MDRIGRMRAWTTLRRVLTVLCAVAAIAPAFAQGTGTAENTGNSVSVPAARQADRVVVVTLDGEIDQWTERSIKRRIEQAEASGADAIVIEIDSPGGEVGAVLEICNAIKGSTISNTVAWVNPDAYSGGAIIALACGEIVTSSPASMGDAFPITFGPEGVRGLSPDERTKFLPPLLTEVADSARRHGYDEFLVQAMVVDGIELWRVRDAETGAIWFINENEYRVLFEGDPPRGKPLLTSVTGGRASEAARSRVASPPPNPNGDADESPDEGEEADGAPAGGDSAGDATPGEDDGRPAIGGDSGTVEGRNFTPASPSVADLSESVSEGLTSASTRPTFTEADRGRYVDPVYIADGTGPIVLRDDQLMAFGFSSAIIESDAELRDFFGATEMVRADPTWSEKMVKTMMHPVVRGVLIVVLLIGLFVEMSSPGLIVPGAVAAGALVGLIAPPMLVGMAGWWEVLAIVAGIALLLVELLVVPGFGLFGVLGLVSLFVGMVGTFIPDGTGGLFGPGDTGDDLFGGVATILLSTTTAGVAIFFISKHFGSIPLLGRLVLQDAGAADDNPDADILAMSPPAEDRVRVGDLGVAASALRPSGRARINGEMIDAIAERGYIDDGDPVEIVARRGFSWVVRPPRTRTGEAGPNGPGGDEGTAQA